MGRYGKIVTCNSTGLKMIRARPEAIIGRPAKTVFDGFNAWALEKVKTEPLKKNQLPVWNRVSQGKT